MGSTNTGRFTDYPGPRKPADDQPAGSGGDPGGGAGQSDACGRAITGQLLDEVERSEYWINHQDVPPVGSDIVLRPQLHGGRLAVALAGNAEIVGYLPTRFNYLRACMEQGWRYGGEVVAAVPEFTALVRVDLRPQ